ncbi:Insulin-like growth factor 2 mRNA-binding protein 2 [Chionoecetes opilio]|uniref:Insulin-like growth factor 2 mRNA-binding protein 2 n=1 Tax=Chionoecetes opilio TaxID=41210 RepID=A0A8J4XL04_CHIOP|nr:Insulin-like growth factor 2 mRNA-binding protein 2 [Chionoecetes opilio]
MICCQCDLPNAWGSYRACQGLPHGHLPGAHFGLPCHAAVTTSLHAGASPSWVAVYEESAYLYIPNSAVGAIIGTKGSHIRNIISSERKPKGVGVEDVRLTVEIVVPSSQVGRIIGKGGQNVRDLQRQTGSVIKLPQQGSTTSEDTTVHIDP